MMLMMMDLSLRNGLAVHLPFASRRVLPLLSQVLMPMMTVKVDLSHWEAQLPPGPTLSPQIGQVGLSHPREPQLPSTVRAPSLRPKIGKVELSHLRGPQLLSIVCAPGLRPKIGKAELSHLQEAQLPSKVRAPPFHPKIGKVGLPHPQEAQLLSKVRVPSVHPTIGLVYLMNVARSPSRSLSAPIPLFLPETDLDSSATPSNSPVSPSLSLSEGDVDFPIPSNHIKANQPDTRQVFILYSYKYLTFLFFWQ